MKSPINVSSLTTVTGLLSTCLVFLTLAAALKAMAPASLGMTYAEIAALCVGLVLELAAFLRLRQDL